jgi:hypothetical protein
MTRNKESGEMVLAVAANAPGLVWRLGISYLRFKRQTKRAGKAFFRSMVSNGMPEKEARDLADEYMSALNLMSIMRQIPLRNPIPAKNNKG